MCGADILALDNLDPSSGSPPRVRSRLQLGGEHVAAQRITSACAEQTETHNRARFHVWDHLRVCGADRSRANVLGDEEGSPPRVRSRRHPQSVCQHIGGITSACAEQTSMRRSVHSMRRDHLRVCGADLPVHRVNGVELGSPPRVRSRPVIAIIQFRANGNRGITSACAEQTPVSPALGAGVRDHLRVCGADSCLIQDLSGFGGSPPRVRSRRAVQGRQARPGGITSACAEQTKLTSSRPCATRDHLRVCGADILRLTPHGHATGSPPRVRSRHAQAAAQAAHRRITSACAEQTWRPTAAPAG